MTCTMKSCEEDRHPANLYHLPGDQHVCPEHLYAGAARDWSNQKLDTTATYKSSPWLLAALGERVPLPEHGLEVVDVERAMPMRRRKKP